MGDTAAHSTNAEFDLDQMVAALERPSVVLGGERYEGQWLSLPQHLGFLKRIANLQTDDEVQATEDFVAVCTDMLDAMQLPGEQMATLPFEVVWKVVMGFLARMQEQMGSMMVPDLHPNQVEAALAKMPSVPSGGSGTGNSVEHAQAEVTATTS